MTTRSSDETSALGARIGQAARPGDLICLNGDLGAGKTTLVQGIGAGLGLPDRQINSPTFALLAEHIGGRIPLYHLDVYRLRDASGLYDIGFDDYLRAGDGLIVIEWAERVLSELPADRLSILLAHGANDDERTIEIIASGTESNRLLEAL